MWLHRLAKFRQITNSTNASHHNSTAHSPFILREHDEGLKAGFLLELDIRIMASFPNIYMHRKAADTASKACEICYKPTTSVLVTAENKVCLKSLPLLFT